MQINNAVSIITNVGKKYNIPIIIDEISTAFRFMFNAYSRFKGILPDFITMGKTLGNGYSISLLMGLKEHMSILNNGEMWISETSALEITGIAALKAVLSKLQNGDYYYKTTKLGNMFVDEISNHLTCNSYPIELISNYPQLIELRFQNDVENNNKYIFWQKLINDGIYPANYIHITESFKESDIDKLINTVKESLKKIYG